MRLQHFQLHCASSTLINMDDEAGSPQKEVCVAKETTLVAGIMRPAVERAFKAAASHSNHTQSV